MTSWSTSAWRWWLPAWLWLGTSWCAGLSASTPTCRASPTSLLYRSQWLTLLWGCWPSHLLSLLGVISFIDSSWSSFYMTQKFSLLLNQSVINHILREGQISCLCHHICLFLNLCVFLQTNISIGFCANFHGCLFIACFVLVLTQSSIFSLLAIAVDRYIAIKNPLRWEETTRLHQMYWQLKLRQLSISNTHVK